MHLWKVAGALHNPNGIHGKQKFRRACKSGFLLVLPGGIIEFSIINAHMPTCDRFSRDKLITFILDNGHAPLS